MPMLIVLIGISGCGKSTFAAKTGLPVISSDAIREELFGDESVQADPALVFGTAHSRIIDLLKQNKDVIFDATNVTSWSRSAILNKIDSFGVACKKVAVIFDVNPEQALCQMRQRSRQVPADVVQRQWENFQKDFADITIQFDEVRKGA